MNDREEFEIAMAGDPHYWHRLLWVKPDGEYRDPLAIGAWLGWQAARATADHRDSADASLVGKVIANDPVHGWHMHPLIDWELIGDGTLLYAGEGQNSGGWKGYAQHLEHCRQCGETSFADCDEGTRLHDAAIASPRSGNGESS